MTTIIDYNLKDLFKIVTDNHIKIKDQVLPPGKYSIDEIPVEVLKKESVRRQFYINKETQEKVDVTDRLKQLSELNSKKGSDGMFATREDLYEYEKVYNDFYSKYELKTVYDEIWVKESINIVKKQFIEERYLEFIESDVIITTKYPKTECKAVCTYTRSFGRMFRLIAKKYGFEEIEDLTFKENTSGLKFSISSTTPHEFSKCNGGFVNTFKHFTPKTFEGSYEELKNRFEKDYKEIETYILAVKLKEEGKPLVNAADTLNSLLHIYNKLRNVTPTKSSQQAYSGILSQILDLKKKIEESVLKETAQK